MHDNAISQRPPRGRGHPGGALPLLPLAGRPRRLGGLSVPFAGSPTPLVSLLLAIALLALAAGPVGARELERSLGDGEGLCAGDPDDGEHKIPVPTIVETPDPKYGLQYGVKSAAIDTPPAAAQSATCTAAPIAASATAGQALGPCRVRSLLCELLASWRPLGLPAWAPTWLFSASVVEAAASIHR